MGTKMEAGVIPPLALFHHGIKRFVSLGLWVIWDNFNDGGIDGRD